MGCGRRWGADCFVARIAVEARYDRYAALAAQGVTDG